MFRLVDRFRLLGRILSSVLQNFRARFQSSHNHRRRRPRVGSLLAASASPSAASLSSLFPSQSALSNGSRLHSGQQGRSSAANRSSCVKLVSQASMQVSRKACPHGSVFKRSPAATISRQIIHSNFSSAATTRVGSFFIACCKAICAAKVFTLRSVALLSQRRTTQINSLKMRIHSSARKATSRIMTTDTTVVSEDARPFM